MITNLIWTSCEQFMIIYQVLIGQTNIYLVYSWMRNSEKFTGTGNLVYTLTSQGLKSIWQLLNSKVSQHCALCCAMLSTRLIFLRGYSVQSECLHPSNWNRVHRSLLDHIRSLWKYFQFGTLQHPQSELRVCNWRWHLSLDSLKRIKGLRGNSYFAQRELYFRACSYPKLSDHNAHIGTT